MFLYGVGNLKMCFQVNVVRGGEFENVFLG
jgi:hypothetical protein